MSLTIDIEQLDRRAAGLWPAIQRRPLGLWELRAHPELPSRRSSSVFAVGDYPKDADWLSSIESFYRSQQLPSRFHISDASPPDLDARLERLGYELELRSLVMAAPVATASEALEALMPLQPAEFEAQWEEQAVDAWLTPFMEIEQYNPQLKLAYKRMLERIEGGKRHLLLRDPRSGTPIAIGTVVVQGAWAGLLNIATSEAYRRQGYGTLLLRLLTEKADQLGAEMLYLQVLATNESAVRLYKRAGFERIYGYHYRTLMEKAL